MTNNEILALTTGPELDRAVNIYVFNDTGKTAPAFSTSDADGMKLLDKLPLFVARVDPAHPNLDHSRPWIAGTLTWEPTVKGDVTSLRVAAPTRLTALCKAALLFTLRPAKAGRAAQQATPAEAARAIAARIGTPAARRPGQLAAQNAPRPGKPGPKPRQTAPQLPERTARDPRLPPQPAIFTTAANAREPLPKRIKEFRGPTPLPVAGGQMPKAEG
jgi:hypothetical protein